MRCEQWQILDVRSIWLKEFASAMASKVAVKAWSPVMSLTGHLESWHRTETLLQPPLEVTHYPLQRGYARAPLRWIAPFEADLVKRLKAGCANPADSPLICSTPFYAPVAERWPGPVVYYVTDLTARYHGLNPRQVAALDRRMCSVARSVCPNSSRIAQYLVKDAGCAPQKITVVANATRRANIALAPLLEAQSLPADIAHLPRPVAGVLGNLAGNMDWVFLAEVVRRTPYLSWVFVGPTSMPIRAKSQARARRWVIQHAHFTGAKPYGDLQIYARCFDVAMLPYRKHEPTYSGSSTRFYEHLAACRPMVATRGFAELLEKPPLIELADTPAEMQTMLDRLRARQFKDGLEIARWEASKTATWEERAETLMSTLESFTTLAVADQR